MEVPVKIKLQQIGRMVGRLTRPATRTQVPKTERLKIERVHIRIDRPHRIIPPHIIFNLRRQKTGLFTANAGFEVAIRHTANPTSIGKIGYEFLPSLPCETHHGPSPEARRRWVSQALNPSYLQSPKGKNLNDLVP